MNDQKLHSNDRNTKPGRQSGGLWHYEGFFGSGGTSQFPVKVVFGRSSVEEAWDSSDAFVSTLTIKLSSDTYQWGRINSGPEEVLQKVPDCHVILTGLRCGLGSPAPALSNVMTKDGKAVKNPTLVMSVGPGSQRSQARDLWNSVLWLEIRNKICILIRTFF